MTKFTDHLWNDLAREHGPTLAQAAALEPSKARLLRRPRFLAGSTLGLAGVGTALVLALGASSPAAYAVTTSGDGSVLVTINQGSALPQANAKLAAMGLDERVEIFMAAGPATVSGPVTCTPPPGATISGPPLKVLVGQDGTEIIRPGQTAGNTGTGTWHLDHCGIMSATGTGNSGNSGDPAANNFGQLGAGNYKRGEVPEKVNLP